MRQLIRLAAFLALSLQGTACYTPLHKAASAGDLKTVRALLDQGADVNSRDAHWQVTPLIQAASADKVEVVRLLLDKGADIEAKSDGGYTAFFLAINSLSVSSARLLLERGADPEFSVAYFTSCGSACTKQETLLQRLLNQRKPAAPREEVSTQALPVGGEKPKPGESDMDRPGYRLSERPDDFAIVVGIGKYSDIPEARFAERDAEAVKEHLLALGVPSRNLVQLSGEKAVKSSIEKYIETWLPKNVRQDSRVFVYFSGHGAPNPESGQAYLLPYDGDPDFLENTGYPIKRLYEKLSSLKAKEIIVAMDACFSGAGGRSVLAKGARPLVVRVEAATAPRNVTVFAAASANQITSTLEDQGHGTFTYYFLKGLSGKAKDASGKVTAKGLHDYLKPKVQDAARRQNRDQEPVLQGRGDRELAQF